MKVTLRGHTHLAPCDGCGSRHIGPRCPPGTTYAARLRAVKIATDWMPYKESTRADGKSGYWDDESLKDLFGNSAAEREEELMEDTQGVGSVSAAELAGPHQAEYLEHFLHLHPDWGESEEDIERPADADEGVDFIG